MNNSHEKNLRFYANPKLPFASSSLTESESNFKSLCEALPTKDPSEKEFNKIHIETESLEENASSNCLSLNSHKCENLDNILVEIFKDNQTKLRSNLRAAMKDTVAKDNSANLQQIQKDCLIVDNLTVINERISYLEKRIKEFNEVLAKLLEMKDKANYELYQQLQNELNNFWTECHGSELTTEMKTAIQHIDNTSQLEKIKKIKLKQLAEEAAEKVCSIKRINKGTSILADVAKPFAKELKADNRIDNKTDVVNPLEVAAADELQPKETQSTIDSLESGGNLQMMHLSAVSFNDAQKSINETTDVPNSTLLTQSNKKKACNQITGSKARLTISDWSVRKLKK